MGSGQFLSSTMLIPLRVQPLTSSLLFSKASPWLSCPPTSVLPPSHQYRCVFPIAEQSLGADWLCERSVPDLDANLVLLLALCALGHVT